MLTPFNIAVALALATLLRASPAAVLPDAKHVNTTTPNAHLSVNPAQKTNLLASTPLPNVDSKLAPNKTEHIIPDPSAQKTPDSTPISIPEHSPTKTNPSINNPKLNTTLINKPPTVADPKKPINTDQTHSGPSTDTKHKISFQPDSNSTLIKPTITKTIDTSGVKLKPITDPKKNVLTPIISHNGSVTVARPVLDIPVKLPGIKDQSPLVVVQKDDWQKVKLKPATVLPSFDTTLFPVVSRTNERVIYKVHEVYVVYIENRYIVMPTDWTPARPLPRDYLDWQVYYRYPGWKIVQDQCGDFAGIIAQHCVRAYDSFRNQWGFQGSGIFVPSSYRSASSGTCRVTVYNTGADMIRLSQKTLWTGPDSVQTGGLSSLVESCASQGRVGYTNVEGPYWIIIDSP